MNAPVTKLPAGAETAADRQAVVDSVELQLLDLAGDWTPSGRSRCPRPTWPPPRSSSTKRTWLPGRSLIPAARMAAASAGFPVP